MNDIKNDTAYAYRSYHSLQNYVRMTVRMHLGILRTLFAAQLTIVSILFMITLTSSVSPWHLGLATFGKILPITFLVYLFHPVIVMNFRRRSRQEFQEHTRRGTSQVSVTELDKQLPKPGRIPLSQQLLLPVSYETQHVFCSGASGTGKTVFLSQVIAAAKKHNLKGIVHGGKDGELAARFYDPKCDLIFNPFDQRSVAFNVYDVISEDSDFESVAASIVPKNATREQFFSNAARDLLTGILRYCAANDEKTNEAVWHCLQQPAAELYKMLISINCEAAAYIESATPQTQSCISTLTQHAKIFRYLQNSANRPDFSLRDWVAGDDRAGFIFLTARTKQRESLKGLMALFINSISNEILSLRDNPDRRLALIIDEFGVLPAMHAVKSLLALGRSKGCSAWIGIQEKAQLDEIYGDNTANTIINQCNSYAIFRMNDTRSADYFSLLFGERESESLESSYSSAARDRRESETYRNSTKTARLILPSEIQALPNLNFYLKIHSHPVSRAKVNYHAYPQVSEAFVPNPAYKLSNVKIPIQKKVTKKPVKQSPGGSTFTVDDFDF